jgi:hypothetical protein
MKVTSLNIQAYQNINALNNQKKTAVKAPVQNITNQKLHGAEFLDHLNKQEIKFLNKNFNNSDNTKKHSSVNHSPEKYTRRIDILA